MGDTENCIISKTNKIFGNAQRSGRKRFTIRVSEVLGSLMSFMKDKRS